MTPSPMTVVAAIRRFAPYLVSQRLRLTGAAVLLLIASVCDAIGVFVLSDVVDGALSADGWSDIARLAAIWILLTAASVSVEYVGSVLAAVASENIVLRLRTALFAHVQRLSPVSHRRRGIGDLLVRHSSDLEAVEHLIGTGTMSLSVAVANAAALITAAFLMSPIVAGVALGACPVLWAVSAFFGRRQTDTTYAERAANSGIADSIHAALAAHETTVAYNQQQSEADRLARDGRRWAAARVRQTRVEAGFGSVLGFAQVCLSLVVTLVAVWQVRSGELSVGQLLALTGYLAMLYPRLQEVAEVRLSVAETAVSAHRIVELLDEPPHRPDPADAQPLPASPDGTAVVRIDDVHFAHDDRPVLTGADLELHPGTITALTGPSGAGKSTLASLICALTDPDAGRVSINGHDLAAATGSSVRDQVTLLPQVPHIRPGTVAENIAYGRPDASRTAVIAAAAAADAHRFIAALPDGYDTVLAGDGLELSGGQRQRLAMARAILRDTPVLVLDEPSASLDDASVAEIIGPLTTLSRGRTTLLITHDSRITTIADRVVRLDEGTISCSPGSEDLGSEDPGSEDPGSDDPGRDDRRGGRPYSGIVSTPSASPRMVPRNNVPSRSATAVTNP